MVKYYILLPEYTIQTRQRLKVHQGDRPPPVEANRPLEAGGIIRRQDRQDAGRGRISA